MEIVVGSTALHYHLPETRPPKDLDVWKNDPSKVNSKKGDDFKVIPTKIINLIEHKEGYATLDSLYTIKCSHLGWDNPMWNKHKQDTLFLKSLGCKIIPELYNELIEFWRVELGDKSFLSLKQDKEPFFTDNVIYLYDHDWLHEQVAFPNNPVYTKCLKFGEDVLIDKTKFDKLSFDEQIRMFKEEIVVIAIERWMVNPNLKKPKSWLESYILSVRKTITSLTKGWATDFLVKNLDIISKPDYSMFEYTLNTIDKLNKETHYV